MSTILKHREVLLPSSRHLPQSAVDSFGNRSDRAREQVSSAKTAILVRFGRSIKAISIASLKPS